MRKSIMSAAAMGILLSGLGVSSASAAVGAGLIVHYSFDADDAADLAGGDQNGAVNGSAAFATGRIGAKAIQLDGADDYVNVGDHPNTGTALTMATWVRANGAITANTALINKYGISGVTNREFRLTAAGDAGGGASSGKPHILVSTTLASGGQTVISNGTSDLPNDNSTWAHLMATFDGSTGTTVFYLNGIQVDTDTNVNVSSFDTSGTAALLIGAETTSLNGTTSRRFFNGAMDDVGIWSAIKTGKEVAAVHGLGYFQGINLGSSLLDSFISAFDATGSTTINGVQWQHVTGLTPIQGTVGGTLAGNDAFVVLDNSGNGMQIVIPEPASLTLLALGGLALLSRRRKS